LDSNQFPKGGKILRNISLSLGESRGMPYVTGEQYKSACLEEKSRQTYQSQYSKGKEKNILVDTKKVRIMVKILSLL
jgi:hypothetical protein